MNYCCRLLISSEFCFKAYALDVRLVRKHRLQDVYVTVWKFHKICQKTARNIWKTNISLFYWTRCRVDHWNHEMERVVLLTDNVIIIIKYDFIKRSAVEGKKIPLLCINKLQIADIVFPSKSLMPWVFKCHLCISRWFKCRIVPMRITVDQLEILSVLN